VRIAVLNGPNLNLLGVREPSLYGRRTLGDITSQLDQVATELGVDIEFAQHNGEGDLIDCIHGWREHVDGIVINAGAYTHTSLALRDALVGVGVPYVEVHITNIYAREPERRHSTLASGALGIVCGLGAAGYELALRGLVAALGARG
jgi:3-dehydroquinate dehydratase II